MLLLGGAELRGATRWAEVIRGSEVQRWPRAGDVECGPATCLPPSPQKDGPPSRGSTLTGCSWMPPSGSTPPPESSSALVVPLQGHSRGLPALLLLSMLSPFQATLTQPEK